MTKQQILVIIKAVLCVLGQLLIVIANNLQGLDRGRKTSPYYYIITPFQQISSDVSRFIWNQSICVKLCNNLLGNPKDF